MRQRSTFGKYPTCAHSWVCQNHLSIELFTITALIERETHRVFFSMKLLKNEPRAISTDSQSNQQCNHQHERKGSRLLKNLQFWKETHRLTQSEW